jgi:tetratricopeptide (TPR) repeat protein
VKRRRFAVFWLALAALPAAYAQADEVEPPEEDESLQPKEYTFNPLQAENEMKVGAFYFKRGSWRAASLRFSEATKWNPSLGEAWRRLGECREKLDDVPGAIDAYRKYLETEPAGKPAKDVEKKVAALNKIAKRGKQN